MQVFKRNKHFPTPTDRLVRGIYAEYQREMRHIQHLWTNIVKNGIGDRTGCVDLDSIRIRPELSHGKVRLVASMRVFSDTDKRAAIQTYVDFFRLYDIYQTQILNAAKSAMAGASADVRKQATLTMVQYTYLLSLAIHAMAEGVFDIAMFRARSGLMDFDDLREAFRARGLGNIVAGGEINTRTGCVIDNDLITAFHRYVRTNYEILFPEDRLTLGDTTPRE